jgi:hypothetical protein
MLISPDAQYRQELTIILSEDEIFALHRFLSDIELDHPDAPKVAKDLRAELWYMLIEVREFNEYKRQEDKP